jgi:hypothetical protein
MIEKNFDIPFIADLALREACAVAGDCLWTSARMPKKMESEGPVRRY